MIKKYKDFSLTQYLEVLASRTPIPGGGSAAALTGALGAALISMVANYSKGKGESKAVERKFERICRESLKMQQMLLAYVDSDSQAYKRFLEARKSSQEKAKAKRESQKIMKQVCKICYQAICLTPFLIEKGNNHLISDIEVAVEMLLAAYNSALTLSKT